MSGSDQRNLMEVTGRSAESLEILARALHVKNAELEPTLRAIASTAVTMLSPARYAALTVLSRGGLIPRASTGEPPLLLDRLQQKLGDGPCIHAAKHQSVFRIEDTGEDDRWPEFCAEAARLEVRSMLCVPLWIDERGLGALSLYADQAAAFGDPHERVAVLLATFAALALADLCRAMDRGGEALGLLVDLLERDASHTAALLALGDVIFQLQSHRIAALIAKVGRVGVVGSALLAEHIARMERIGDHRVAAVLTRSAQVMQSFQVAALALPVTNGVIHKLKL